MLEQAMRSGAKQALARLGVKVADMPGAAVAPAAAGGMMDKLRGFGHGQLDAAKDLFGNLRGGLGGQMSPDVLPHPDPGIMRQAHRARAVGNLRTLAPSLVAGGALYAMHQRRKSQDQAQQQQQQMSMAQPAYPM